MQDKRKKTKDKGKRKKQNERTLELEWGYVQKAEASCRRSERQQTADG